MQEKRVFVICFGEGFEIEDDKVGFMLFEYSNGKAIQICSCTCFGGLSSGYVSIFVIKFHIYIYIKFIDLVKISSSVIPHVWLMRKHRKIAGI